MEEKSDVKQKENTGAENNSGAKKNFLKHNELSKDAISTLKKRTIIALIMLVVFVPCLVLGGWFYFILVFLAIGAATYEIAHAPMRKFSLVVWLITFILMYALIFWILFKVNYPDWESFTKYGLSIGLAVSFHDLWISPIAICVMIATYLFIVIVRSDFSIKDACYLITVTLLLAFGFQSLLLIRYSPFYDFALLDGFDISSPVFKYAQSMFLMLYLLIAIFFNDIGAYLTGILFGKHKMNPRISPKKTWEGFVGGILISCALSLTFGLLVAYFKRPMLPSLSFDKWYWILIISFVLPFIGNLGDFAFSAIKRSFDLKDYSKVLGPHGGILDRIDSSIFGAIALAALVIFIRNGWNFFIQ